MATVWVTYAWADNSAGDVDYIAQELNASGLSVKLDRWNIEAGKRLWEQIEHFIQSPDQCDAWVLYATANSLGSEPCKEEFAYALDRALHSRGNSFPVIGLFPSTIDSSLIPAAIRTRLYVSLTDPNWKERIKSSAEGLAPSIHREPVLPYFIQVHPPSDATGNRYIVEVRPRAGTWSPFVAAIPSSEKERVGLGIMLGPAGRVTTGGVLFSTGEGVSDDGLWWIRFAQNEATPTQSYYISLSTLPSKLAFGVKDGDPVFLVENLASIQ